jgi:DNA replication protein DnaC
MIAADPDLDALFKRLHLANARRVWRDLVHRAEREAWTYRDFLTLLVTEEIAHRQQTRLGRLTRRAHFPFLKTIDDFNFTYQSSLRLHMLGSALTPDFVTEGRSLIFLGKPGRGKTHLAVAMAYRAIQNGFDAFFTTAATLIDDLSAAFRDGQLAQALQTYTHPAVLVVDEVGYLTYGTDAANMLFHVVNERHRRHRAMIFTTNKALKAWGRVLHDEDLGQAIIDRVLERGRLIRLDGPSIRTLHLKLDEALKDESDQEDEVARISGITWPEFPEPTNGEIGVVLVALRVRPIPFAVTCASLTSASCSGPATLASGPVNTREAISRYVSDRCVWTSLLTGAKPMRNGRSISSAFRPRAILNLITSPLRGPS